MSFSEPDFIKLLQSGVVLISYFALRFLFKALV